MSNISKNNKMPDDNKGNKMPKANYTCGRCGKVFKDIKELLEHSKIHDTGRSSVSTQPRSVVWRWMPYHGKQLFVCSECCTAFRQKEMFTRHRINRHTPGQIPNPPRMHVCPECNKRFTFRADVFRHVQVHTTPNERTRDMQMRMSAAYALISLHESGGYVNRGVQEQRGANNTSNTLSRAGGQHGQHTVTEEQARSGQQKIYEHILETQQAGPSTKSDGFINNHESGGYVNRGVQEQRGANNTSNTLSRAGGQHGQHTVTEEQARSEQQKIYEQSLETQQAGPSTKSDGFINNQESGGYVNRGVQEQRGANNTSNTLSRAGGQHGQHTVTEEQARSGQQKIYEQILETQQAGPSTKSDGFINNKEDKVKLEDTTERPE